MGEFIKRLGKSLQTLLNKIFKKKNWVSIEELVSKKLESLFGDGELESALIKIPVNAEMSENFFNIPLTILPKHIKVKTLLVSLAANQPYDYQAVDLSQYEERGLAHFIVGRTTGFQEILEEFQEDRKWLEEALREEKERSAALEAALAHSRGQREDAALKEEA